MDTYVRFRSARPALDLVALERFYVDALGCSKLAAFTGHDDFDGLVVGAPDAGWQVEFLVERGRVALPPPDPEQLLVFYVRDRAALDARCLTMDAAGCERVAPNNPYWQVHGVTYRDPEGYAVVIAVAPG